MQNRLSTQVEFQRIFQLTEDEKRGFQLSEGLFKISSTPYYAGLATTCDAIRRILIPTAAETQGGTQHMNDPLGEHDHSPTPRLVHRYSDRVLFLVTDTCSVYCRYCTRKHFTGQDYGFIQNREYENSINYIKNHPGIREVIFSGGDPLTLSNGVLDKIMRDVRSIPHVEIIRMGSRMPVVCPMRIDNELCVLLRRYSPVYMMTHFNHPKELTSESVRALSTLVDHGIPVFNQMVLLNGVNNHVNIVQALSRRLLYLRVKPYYMFQCDPSQGTDHLRIPVEHSEQIVKEMWGHLSGLAMPTLSLDIPGGGGKTTLVPDFTISKIEGGRVFEGWDGIKGVYVDPKVPAMIPQDAEEYAAEWNSLKSAKISTPAQDGHISRQTSSENYSEKEL